MVEILTKQKCYYCGHQGRDVNHLAHVHIGGRGIVDFPICDDESACIARCDKLKEKYTCKYNDCRGNLLLDYDCLRCLQCNREHNENGELITPKVARKVNTRKQARLSTKRRIR